MSLEVKQLSKFYGKQAAVKNVSFSLMPGKIYGFLGPNGAGKSTTFKMITGFLKPDEGTVLLHGHNIQEEPIMAKRLVGYLPEHNPLYMHMYVREMLRFAGGIHGMKGKHLSGQIDDVIERTGLQKEAHKTIGQLSKGYRQRVGIAQAILHNPEVLILDEPLSGLDPLQLEELRSVIRELGQKKTLIFSSHILQEAEQLCEHILLINNGQLVGDGSIASLGIQDAKTQAWSIAFNRSLSEKEMTSLHDICEDLQVNGKEYNLTFSKKEKANAKLLNWAAEHQLEIEKLQRSKVHLKDVFKSLTK